MKQPFSFVDIIAKMKLTVTQRMQIKFSSCLHISIQSPDSEPPNFQIFLGQLVGEILSHLVLKLLFWFVLTYFSSDLDLF